MNKLRIGVVMDPLRSINILKDSTLAMIQEAQCRQWEIYYMEVNDLFARDGIAYARMRQLKVNAHIDPSILKAWYQLGDETIQSLSKLDVILMRKDPPFNMEYIYCTYLLELAEKTGTQIINKPQSLRDANEKFFCTWFPQCCAPTVVTRDATLLQTFIDEQKTIVMKPLSAMGGTSIFLLHKGDPNLNVTFETLSQNGHAFVMVQKFIPEIKTHGDKRILLINGEPIPYALARIPASNDFRGNLAAGAKGIGVRLTDRDHWLCKQIGPTLKQKGLMFVGLDVIGDYITEINVTSPTGIREIDQAFSINICGRLMDEITFFFTSPPGRGRPA